MDSGRLFVKLFVLLTCIAFAFSKIGQANDKVVACLIASVTARLPSKGAYTIENVDPTLCTHIIYGFADINYTTSEIRPSDPKLDITEKGYERAVNLRKKNPHLKVQCLYKYSHLSDSYLNILGNPSHWWRIYALGRRSKSKLRGDKQNYVLLCKELKASLQKHKLILTAGFESNIAVIDKAFDIRGLNQHLDYLHIMTFAYSDTWKGHIAPDAPLDYNGTHCVNKTIQHFINLGASPSKIVLGIPFYARTYITDGAGNFGDVAKGRGFPGPYTRTEGVMGYNELCELLNNRTLGWKTTFDQRTSQSIARRRDVAKKETWVAIYDSTQSVINKVRYANSQHLAGVGVFISAFDDFRGVCEGHKRYPLLRAINQTMYAESEVTSVKSVFSLYFSSISYPQ